MVDQKIQELMGILLHVVVKLLCKDSKNNLLLGMFLGGYLGNYYFILF